MKHNQQQPFVADRKGAPDLFRIAPDAVASALSNHTPGIYLRFDATSTLPAPLGQAPGGGNCFCLGLSLQVRREKDPGGMIG